MAADFLLLNDDTVVFTDNAATCVTPVCICRVRSRLAVLCVETSHMWFVACFLVMDGGRGGDVVLARLDRCVCVECCQLCAFCVPLTYKSFTELSARTTSCHASSSGRTPPPPPVRSSSHVDPYQLHSPVYTDRTYEPRHRLHRLAQPSGIVAYSLPV